MKTSTFLGLLLVAVLAVSWAAANPVSGPDFFLDSFESREDVNDLTKESVEDDYFDRYYVRRKRQLHGSFGVNRGPFGRDYNAGLGYNKNFNNGRTSVGVHAQKQWGASGRGHGASLSFSHKFRR